jgi:hypothetical protein
VKTSGGGYHFLSRTQHQMVRVAENHLGSGFRQIARLQRFYRAERAHIHENGSFHDPVSRRQPRQPRGCIYILFYDLKMHRGIFYQKPLPNSGK